MTIVDWLMVVLYLVLLVVIGVQAIRKVQSSDDFAVAGRRIIWPVMFATLGASLLGGGASLGSAGQVFTNGYVYMFWKLGEFLCAQMDDHAGFGPSEGRKGRQRVSRWPSVTSLDKIQI